jgi:hypothetical protein
VGVLYRVIEAVSRVHPEDREEALGVATTQLHAYLQIVRDFFEMDKGEAST